MTPEQERAALITRLQNMRGPFLGDGINPGVTTTELIAALTANPTSPAVPVEPACVLAWEWWGSTKEEGEWYIEKGPPGRGDNSDMQQGEKLMLYTAAQVVPAEPSSEIARLWSALLLAAGALEMVSPCIDPQCKAEQTEWLQDAQTAVAAALKTTV